MVSTDNEIDTQGELLLTAVERIVEDCDDLIADVEGIKEEVGSEDLDDEAILDKVAERIIATYSTKSAVTGGLTALPALLPGGGTIVALVGGSMVDMTFMLKHEVEMTLCLTYLYGHDIREEKERWLAYVLAAVSTYEAKSGRNYFADLADAQLEALGKYTPRQLSKLAVTVIGRVALVMASKSLVRALPLVGIVVGASANKVITPQVGWRCVQALDRVRGGPRLQESVVDARIK